MKDKDYIEIFGNNYNKVKKNISMFEIKINEYKAEQEKKKIKKGRPSSLSTEDILCIVHCVLITGNTWKHASKLVTGTTKYSSTANRNYLNWVNAGLINSQYVSIQTKHNEDNINGNFLIDSTDVKNQNMSRSQTYKSFKLHKQALRVSILTDSEKKPVNYSVEPAHKVDSDLGYELLKMTKIKRSKKIYVGGDTGYRMNDTKIADLRKHNFIVAYQKPKKKKEKRLYKTKNYIPQRKRIRHSKQMKKCLEKRCTIEHFNSIFHRSFKHLDTVSDRTVATYNSFIQLAFCMILTDNGTG